MDRISFPKFPIGFNMFKNSAQINLTNLSLNVFEAFILGYSLISKFILNTFSFNVGIVVLIGFILFAVVILATYI